MNRLITTVVADTMEELKILMPAAYCWFKRSSFKGCNLMLSVTPMDEHSRADVDRIVVTRLADYVSQFPSAPAEELLPLNSIFMNYSNNCVITAPLEETEDNPEEETALLTLISSISIRLLKTCMPEDESDLIQLMIPYYAAVLCLQIEGAAGVTSFYKDLAADVINTYPDNETVDKRIRAAFETIFDHNIDELCSLMNEAYECVFRPATAEPCLADWLQITASLTRLPSFRATGVFTGLLRLLTNQLGLDIINSINVMLIVARATEELNLNPTKYAYISDRS